MLGTSEKWDDRIVNEWEGISVVPVLQRGSSRSVTWISMAIMTDED
ncbi:uncharacterized protein J3R85_006531 [Psidium guajava]|nr:uncharacterized protein J3R85_006531 [Psidium guajava]